MTEPAATRVCFSLQVRPHRIEEYRRAHAAVWADLLPELRACGWSDYSIRIQEDGLLTGYLETQDLAAAQAALGATEVKARWQAAVARFLCSPSHRPSDPLPVLPMVFQLEYPRTPRTDLAEFRLPPTRWEEVDRSRRTRQGIDSRTLAPGMECQTRQRPGSATPQQKELP